MHFKEKSISLAHICAEDSTYRITTARRSDDLKVSIAAMGLIHPPIFQRSTAGYRIISGFRRIEAIRDLGQTDLKACLLPADCSESTRVRLAIADNSLQRPLNLLESSRALNLLSRIAVDESHLSEMAAVLSLPDNPAMIAKIISLNTMAAPIQMGVESGALTLAMALELDRFDVNIAESLARTFIDLRLGLNRQRELLTLLNEIAKREDRPIDAVLAEEDIRKIIDNDDLDNPRKSRQLRALLYQRRYPAISEKSQRFNGMVKSMRLGDGVKLIPPGNFEGTTYTLSITFDRIDHLMGRGKCLETLGQSDALKSFLED
jgi:ParB family chromosome partitioning protein